MIIFRGLDNLTSTKYHLELCLVRPGGGSAGDLSDCEQRLPVLPQAVPLLHTDHQQGTLLLSQFQISPFLFSVNYE